MDDLGGGNSQHSLKKHNGNRWLVALLVLLVVMIVVIAVLFLVLSNKSDDGDIDQPEKIGQVSEEIQRLMDEDEIYQVGLKIADLYNGGEKEKANLMYDEESNKALSAQDFDAYIDLMISRSTLLSLDGTCEESMALYDKIDFDRIPEDYRDSIYANAINDSVRCGDAEHETYWRNRTNEK